VKISATSTEKVTGIRIAPQRHVTSLTCDLRDFTSPASTLHLALVASNFRCSSFLCSWTLAKSSWSVWKTRHAMINMTKSPFTWHLPGSITWD